MTKLFRPLPSLMTSIVLTAQLAACGASTDETQDGDPAASGGDRETQSADYDLTLLEEYKQALPKSEQLDAPSPGPEPTANALTLMGDAELGGLAAKSARDINAVARGIVFLLKQITDTPPTMYDSKKKEFVWGPWDNDDGHGQVLVYIKENDEGDDFKYGYALVRLSGRDLATAAPVVWGGATPDPKDDRNGAGVTLWDFEANEAFEAEHDPNYDEADARPQGRFAMVYGRGDGDDGNFAFNVAVFRDFLPEDAEPGAAPADLDYYFGHVVGDDGNVVDFLDWMLTADLCSADPETCFESPSGEAESLGLRAAFVNRGIGRAEATISGGDLAGVTEVTECWDADVDRTYMGVAQDGEMLAEEGSCADPFSVTLAELGVPTLSDVDQAGLEMMDCVASNGLHACTEDEAAEEPSAEEPDGNGSASVEAASAELTTEEPAAEE